MTVNHNVPAQVDGMKHPYLVFAARPEHGHTYPILQIARDMIRRGFEATILTGEQYGEDIIKMGARPVTLPHYDPTPEALGELAKVTSKLQTLAWGLRHIVAPQMPIWYGTLKETLETLRLERPGQQFIIMSDLAFTGQQPLVRGAPLPKGFSVRPPVIHINVVPLAMPSIDTGPFGLGLPPDSSESGRARNKLLNAIYYGPDGPYGPFGAEHIRLLKSLGATDIPSTVEAWGYTTSFPDITLQVCSPSLEFPRSDLPDNVHFVGCLPRKPIGPDYEYPQWLKDIVSPTDGSTRKKRIIGVAQGTIAVDYTDLIIPTIQGLANDDDVVVIALLGKKGATLPKRVTVPANARVVDYMPYEVVLNHADVWVANAGYGGFTQGVMHGVPMVLAGDTQDKPDIAMVGEWSGVACNLRTGTPTPEQVAKGVREILSNDSYKARVVEVQKENEAMNCLDAVEKHIWDIFAKMGDI